MTKNIEENSITTSMKLVAIYIAGTNLQFTIGSNCFDIKINEPGEGLIIIRVIFEDKKDAIFFVPAQNMILEFEPMAIVVPKSELVIAR